MKILKTVLGILLLLGGFISLIVLMKSLPTYEAADVLGHVIAIIIVFWIAYLLLKSKKK